MLHLDKQFFQILHEQIEAGRDRDLIAQLGELRAADIAEVLENLRIDDANYLYRLLENDSKADVLMELDEEKRTELLSGMTAGEIAEEVLENLDSDDAADVMSELPESKAEEVIQLLDDIEQASDIRDLLNYEEGTAGAMMAKELVKVQAEWTVNRAIREIRRQAEELEQVYTVYVVDPLGKLTGRLSLKHLLLNAESTRTKIQEIQETEDIITIGDLESSEKATKLMERYDLVALPVVNHEHELVGRITIDDAVDMMLEDAERDYQLASGISEDVESRDSVLTLTRARLPWLLIGMVGGIGGAYVIGAFDIQKNAEMALFIPLIAAMGGNVGVQSAAIVVQGLASSNMGTQNMVSRLYKELGVGIINGLICGLLILGSSFLLGFGTALSITVSVSLIFVIIFAALFGTFVPLMLNRYRIDPALATGPFITTVNDIIGLMIYFAVGTLIVGMI
ncbi:magnesium transporter [Flavobacteriales bacterium]|jgi:magnesium transporter|nr:magnesium transporter [Flavobacteriales bacterium]